MPDFSKIYLFRMTHISNVAHILECGMTHRLSPNSNPRYQAIGDSSLILTRNIRHVPDGRPLGDFIPFYFWHSMPMLYVIQNGFNEVPKVNKEDIVYCICTLASIIEHGLSFYFTNGHSVDRFSSFFTEKDIGNIEQLVDFSAVKAQYWKDEKDTDRKRRKEAEFLVAGDIPTSAIKGYIANNEAAKAALTLMGVPEGQVSIKPNFYF